MNFRQALYTPEAPNPQQELRALGLLSDSTIEFSDMTGCAHTLLAICHGSALFAGDIQS